MKIKLIESPNDIVERIVDQTVSNYLNEGLSDILYHGTYIPRLKNILTTNTINLTNAVGSQTDFHLNKGNEYYFSTQRANGLTGYISRNGCSVILVLNGQKLNQNFKGFPVNYWGWSMDKKDHETNDSYLTALKSKELEDRIVSKEPEIPNANKYISEIHVHHTTDFPEDRKEFFHMLANAKNLRIPIYVYQDKNDFKSLNKSKAVKKATDLEFKKSEFPREKGERDDIRRSLNDLGTILAFPIFNSEYKKHPAHILRELFPDFNDDEIIKIVNRLEKLFYNMEHGFYTMDIFPSLNTAIHNNKSNANKYIRKGLHFFVNEFRKANVKSLKQYVDKTLENTLEDYGNMSEDRFGYRAGSIEGTPPETLGNFRGGRGTGHFGTGWYFFGTKKQANDYDEREVNVVDFDKYNLLRVKDNLTGLKLHDKLKAFEGTNIKGWTNNYNGIALASIFYTRKEGNFGTMYDATDMKVTDTLVPNLKIKLIEFATKNIDNIVDEVNNSDDFYKENPEEKLKATDMNFSIEYDLKKDELNQYVFKFIDNYLQKSRDFWGNELEKPRVGYSDIYNTEIVLDFLNNEIVNKMTEMVNKRTKGEVYFYWMGRRVDELIDVISKIDTSRDKGMMKNTLLKKIPSLLRRDPYMESHMNKTTFGTELIKALGYNGIDVRGVGESQGTTGMDNSQYGSVIYDLKNTK